MLHGAGCRKPSGVFVHGFLTVNGAEDVEVARHVHHGAALPRAPAARGPALSTTPASSARASTTSICQPRRLRRARELRPRRQARQHREPLRRVRRSVAAASWRPQLPDPALYAEFAALRGTIAQCYDEREYSAALRDIMGLADRANQYIDNNKPWVLAKDPGARPPRCSRCARRASISSACS